MVLGPVPVETQGSLFLVPDAQAWVEPTELRGRKELGKAVEKVRDIWGVVVWPLEQISPPLAAGFRRGTSRQALLLQAPWPLLGVRRLRSPQGSLPQHPAPVPACSVYLSPACPVQLTDSLVDLVASLQPSCAFVCGSSSSPE